MMSVLKPPLQVECVAPAAGKLGERDGRERAAAAGSGAREHQGEPIGAGILPGEDLTGGAATRCVFRIGDPGAGDTVFHFGARCAAEATCMPREDADTVLGVSQGGRPISPAQDASTGSEEGWCEANRFECNRLIVILTLAVPACATLILLLLLVGCLGSIPGATRADEARLMAETARAETPFLLGTLVCTDETDEAADVEGGSAKVGLSRARPGSTAPPSPPPTPPMHASPTGARATDADLEPGYLRATDERAGTVKAAPAPTLGWRQLSYVKEGRHILQPSSADLVDSATDAAGASPSTAGGLRHEAPRADVDPKHAAEEGCARAGLWCLIGPSGAGKSTLLAILAGRKATGRVGGHVTLDGAPLSAAERRRRLCYVSQADVLPPNSTVLEHLMLHARLRLPHLGLRARAAIARNALEALAMGHKAHAGIGGEHIRGLSGGERRRVSVGVELMVLMAATDADAASASVMIADEPLSGLDAVSARLLVEALSAASRAGASVLLSVHQPTQRFMRAAAGVVVMGTGGRLVYCGTVRTPTGGCALSAAFDEPGVLRLADWSANPAEAVLEVMADQSLQVGAHAAWLPCARRPTPGCPVHHPSPASHMLADRSPDGSTRSSWPMRGAARSSKRTRAQAPTFRCLPRRQCRGPASAPSFLTFAGDTSAPSGARRPS